MCRFSGCWLPSPKPNMLPIRSEDQAGAVEGGSVQCNHTAEVLCNAVMIIWHSTWPLLGIQRQICFTNNYLHIYHKYLFALNLLRKIYVTKLNNVTTDAGWRVRLALKEKYALELRRENLLAMFMKMKCDKIYVDLNVTKQQLNDFIDSLLISLAIHLIPCFTITLRVL